MIDIGILKKLFGSDELVNKFLLVFQRDAPELIGRMKEDHKLKDGESVSVNAHSLKSQLAYLGVERATELAFQIEVQSHTGSEYPTETIERLIKHLDAEIRIIVLEIGRKVG